MWEIIYWFLEITQDVIEFWAREIDKKKNKGEDIWGVLDRKGFRGFVGEKRNGRGNWGILVNFN